MSEEESWDRLEAELAAWQATGRVATLWWRDDDAGPLTPALRRVLALAELHAVPLALAMVPTWATAETAAALAAAGEGISVLQHGYAHANYAPAGEKKFELGPERPAAIVVAEIAQGWQRLEQLFGARFRPVLVPPWNRMAGYLPPYLAELRYRGLSQFGARSRRAPAEGLVQANTHVDIVFWKSAPPRFAGAAKLIGEFARHLAARRLGEADPGEPARHPAVAWLPAARVFADAPAP